MKNLKLADFLAKERAELGICPLPFTHPHIYDHSGITVYPCCPGDNCHAYGKMENGASWEDVWNSEAAKAVRGKILKGDYCDCNLQQCATKGRYLAAIDYLESAAQSSPLDTISNTAAHSKKKPLIIKFCNDFECNLYCTTCRDKIRVHTEEEIEELNKKIDSIFLPACKDADVVYLAGDGDPFFSRHYRALIKAISATYPHIKFILHTNGILCNEKNCMELGIADKIYSILISINASSKDTYESINRGGKWETLLENIKWVNECRKKGRIKKLFFSFIVQQKNYKEMPDFVRFGQQNQAEVRFTLYQDWGTGLDYNTAAVFEENHPEFLSYCRMLKDPVFHWEGCYLDPFSKYLRSENLAKLYFLKYVKAAGARIKQTELYSDMHK